MRGEVALPAFQMDCRDWLVIRPEENGLPDEIGGTPLLAVLSTAVIDVDDFRSVSAVLTLGLFTDQDLWSVPVGDGSVAAEIVDAEDPEGTVRYLLPSPDGQLALVAEFTTSGTVDAEVQRRIQALMTSFRWAA